MDMPGDRNWEHVWAIEMGLGLLDLKSSSCKFACAEQSRCKSLAQVPNGSILDIRSPYGDNFPI